MASIVHFQREAVKSFLVLGLVLNLLVWLPRPVAGFDQPWDGGHNTTTPDPNDPDTPDNPDDPPDCPSGTSPKGSPVFLKSGALILAAHDYYSKTTGPALNLTRTYINQDRYDGAFGYGWHIPYSIRLYEVTNITSIFVIIRRDDGQRWRYEQNQDGSYTPKTQGVLHPLVKNPDGTYTLNYSCSDCFSVEGDSLNFTQTGLLSSVVDKNGNSLNLAYDSEDRLTAITDAAGRILRFAYDASNKVILVTDPLERDFSYEYDANHNLTAAADPAGNRTLYFYNTDHDLINIIDPEGNVAMEISYDTADRVTRCKEYELVETFAYYPASSYTVKTTPAGTYTYYYDVNGNVTRVVGPDSSSRQEVYNVDGRPTQLTNENGAITRYEYDGLGNLTLLVEASGTALERSTHYTYDPTLNLRTGFYRTSVANPSGYKSTVLSYDSQGNLTSHTEGGYLSETQAYAYTTSYFYDAFGQKTAVDGPLAGDQDTVRYAYDEDGNLTRITLPHNIIWQYGNFTAAGRPQTITDPNNHVRQLEFDLLDQVTKIIWPSESIQVTLAYDALGNITTVSHGNGRTYSYSYTQKDLLAQTTNPAGDRMVYLYDTRSNLTRVAIYDGQNQLRYSVDYAYDVKDRCTKTTYADGSYNTSAFDTSGNLTSYRSLNGITTALYYDVLNRFTKQSVTTPTGVQDTTFTYDIWDNLASAVDPKGNTFTMTHDDMYRVKSTTSSDTGTTTYQYDAPGNVIARTDANGVTINLAYDALNRLISRLHADATQDVTYSYDESGSSNGKTQMTGMSDPGGTSVYHYDSQGRMNHAVKTILGAEYDTTYQFDYDDNLTAMTYPSGLSVYYDYDTSGRVTRVRALIDGNEQTIVSGITYLPYGSATAMTLGNGIARSLAYDSRYRLTRIIDGSVQNLTVGYDNGGNITALTDAVTPARSQTFGYDALHQLTSATGIYGAEQYYYDLAGNRTRLIDGVGTSDYAYTGNRLTAISGVVTDAFSYDANGNITADSARSYYYNAGNRLTKITAGTETLGDYTMSGTTERVIREENGEAVIGHYDNELQLLEESAADGTPLRSWIYLAGQPIAKVENNQVYYYHLAPNDTPLKLTDAAGTVVWDATYQPFGAAAIVTGSSSSPLRLPGQVYDQATGLHYNTFRYYNPNLGRYLMPDPISIRGGLNFYNYVMNNPLNRTDRFGLWGDETHGVYSKEDHGWSNPFNPFSTWRHFRDIKDSESDLQKAIDNKDYGKYERHMHQGQDYFSHYCKGYRWYKGGHVPDSAKDMVWSGWGRDPDKTTDDPTKYKEMVDWTKKWEDKWEQKNGSLPKRWQDPTKPKTPGK